MAKLSDYPAIVKLVKQLRAVQEAAEVGTDYGLAVKGVLVFDVPAAQVLPLLNARITALKNQLNTYGVDADA